MVIKNVSSKNRTFYSNVLFIGRFEPSSKLCHKCGYINQDLKLLDREWVCPVCGEKLYRDVNAAMNIKKMSLNPQALVGFEEKANDITDRR